MGSQVKMGFRNGKLNDQAQRPKHPFKTQAELTERLCKLNLGKNVNKIIKQKHR